MKVSRRELLGLLSVLKPAVASSRNQVPELAHVWFDGEYASAFNDVLGIRVAFKTEFTGGMLGEKLTGVLDRSHDDMIGVECEDEEAVFAIGSAFIKLTRRPIEDWKWFSQEYQPPKEGGYVVSDAFRDAVGAALLSVGATNTMKPEQCGVTVIQNGAAADLYSTNAVSMSWIWVKTGNKPVVSGGSRVILPTPFCDLIKALKYPAELRFDENGVFCLTKVDLGAAAEAPEEDGVEKKEEKKVKVASKSDKAREVVIFSKLVPDDDPVAFDRVVAEHTATEEGGEEVKYAKVPGELKQRAERAMVLLEDQPIEIEVKKNQLYLYAHTPYGEVDDVLGIKGHPDVKAKVDLTIFRRALDVCDAMRISSSSVVLTGPNNLLHIIACK